MAAADMDLSVFFQPQSASLAEKRARAAKSLSNNGPEYLEYKMAYDADFAAASAAALAMHVPTGQSSRQAVEAVLAMQKQLMLAAELSLFSAQQNAHAQGRHEAIANAAPGAAARLDAQVTAGTAQPVASYVAALAQVTAQATALTDELLIAPPGNAVLVEHSARVDALTRPAGGVAQCLTRQTKRLGLSIREAQIVELHGPEVATEFRDGVRESLLAPLCTMAQGTLLFKTPSPRVVVEVFADLCCPFSNKMHACLSSVLPAYERQGVDMLFQQVPQPWHPQSAVMHEAMLAAKLVDEAQYFGAVRGVFASQADFFDDRVHDATRAQLTKQLVDVICAATTVDASKLAAKLAVSGAGNCGTQATVEMKHACRYHRVRGVHTTPTVFINGIEAPDVGSAWTPDQWREKLDSLLEN